MGILKSSLITLLTSYLLLSLPIQAQQVEEFTEENKDNWQVLYAGTLLAIPGEQPIGNATLVIKNDRIDQLLEGFQSAEQLGLDQAEVIDLRDKFVLPGLIDAHVHLTMDRSLDREQDESGDKPDESLDVYALALGVENARKTVEAGFTTVRNLGSSGWSIFALRDGVNSGKIVGPRIFASGHTIRIGSESEGGECYSVDSCKQAVRRQIDMGADVIKIYATCSGGQLCSRIGSPSPFLADELQAVVDTAKTRELIVAAHAHNVRGINMALNAGVDSIEHGTLNDSSSRQLFKKYGTYLVPTLMVLDRIRRINPEREDSMMKTHTQTHIDHHEQNINDAFQAGIKIAAGSDAGVVPHGENARELEFYTIIGMTPMEAIVTATINSADLLGQSHNIGSLQVGKYADIIATDVSPLEDITALKEISFVMASGKKIK
jgi:imidazolonepropionase-like amidohydrolase